MFLWVCCIFHIHVFQALHIHNSLKNHKMYIASEERYCYCTLSFTFSRKFRGNCISRSYHEWTTLWPWFLEACLTSQALSSVSIDLETRGSLNLAVLWLPKILTAKLGNIIWLKVGLQQAPREEFWNFSVTCLVCCRAADLRVPLDRFL